MMPVCSRAMEGPSANLNKKAKHHNMLAPSLGVPFSLVTVFWASKRK